MAWIKYTASYKHGPGKPEWIDVGSESEEGIEELFREHDREHGDPEGIRRGKYKVYENPPLAVLDAAIEKRLSEVASLSKYLGELCVERHKLVAKRRGRG